MARFDTPGRVAFRISTPSGRVTVDTWGEPGVDVEVTALRGDDGSRQAAAETRIEAKERGSLHEILVEVPKREGRFGIFGRSAEIGIAIRCPEGADVDVTTHSSDVEGRGPLGDVTVKSASGDVSVGDVRQLLFNTASGDLSAGAVAGVLTTKSASGDVDVRSVGGPATVSTVSGDVRIGGTDEDATLNSVSGDIDLQAAGAGGARQRGLGRRQRRRPAGPRALDRRAVGERHDALRPRRRGPATCRRGRGAGRAPGPHGQRRRPHLALRRARSLARPGENRRCGS